MEIEEIQKSLGDIKSKLIDIKKSENENIEGDLEDIKSNLQKIHHQEFNIMDVFGINKRELSHSAFLAWLLDPSETHDLGNAFLKGFLEKMVDKKQINNISFEKVKVVQEESGEESKPDIIVSNETFFLLIENKIDSSEGKEQTHRLHRDFHDETHPFELFVYLTPTEDRPNCKEFKPLDYYDIKDILNSLKPKNDKIKYIIDEYVKNLKVNILSNEFEGFGEKAKLYFEHYDAVEEVWKSWSDNVERFFQAIDKKIQAQAWYNPKCWWTLYKGHNYFLVSKEEWYPRDDTGVSFVVNINPPDKDTAITLKVYAEGEKAEGKEWREKFNNEFWKNWEEEKKGDFETVHGNATLIRRYLPLDFEGMKILDKVVSAIDDAVKRFTPLIDKCVKKSKG